MNGYGERCGNANLVSIIPALKLKMGSAGGQRRAARAPQRDGALRGRRLQRRHLGARSPTWARPPSPTRAGCTWPPCEQAPQTFEHVDPAAVGNEQRILIVRALRQGRRAAQGARDRPRARGRRRARRDACSSGSRTASTAATTTRPPTPPSTCCCARSWRRTSRCSASRASACIVEKREDGKAVVEATIKVHVGGERIISTAEGNGPVNALDAALRQAIVSKYPHLADIELVNYKVRILDENKGTGAVTRVLLDASDGDETWGSIGVSENIIEASWEALVDSIEYGMLQERADREGRRRAGPAAGRRLRARRGRRRRAALPLRRRRRRAARPAGLRGRRPRHRRRASWRRCACWRRCCPARSSPWASTTGRTPTSCRWPCRPSRSSS